MVEVSLGREMREDSAMHTIEVVVLCGKKEIHRFYFTELITLLCDRVVT